MQIMQTRWVDTSTFKSLRGGNALKGAERRMWKRFAATIIGAVTWSALAGDLEGSSRKLVTLEDLARLDEGYSAATLDLSSDGELLAIEHKKRLVILNARTGAVTAELGEGFVPLWAPQSRWLAFYSTRSGNLQLWLWKWESGNVRQLTSMPGGIEYDFSGPIVYRVNDGLQFSWSPDQTEIAFASRPPASRAGNEVERSKPQSIALGKSHPLVLTNSTAPSLTLQNVFGHGDEHTGIAGARDTPLTERSTYLSQVFVASIARGEVRQLTRGARGCFQPAWSPRGRYVAYASYSNEREERLEGEIGVVDAAAGKQLTLAQGASAQHQPRWSSDGSNISYLSSADKSHRYLPSIETREFPSGRALHPALSIDRRIFQYSRTARSDEFLVSYSDGVYIRLGRLRSDSVSITEVSGKGNVPFRVEGFAQGSDGKILWVQHDPQKLSQVWAWQPGLESPTPIHDLEDASHLRLGRVAVARWKSTRGEDVEGSVLFPPDFDAGKRYPMIVDVYPLIGGSYWLSPSLGNQAWGSMGYIVFRPSPRAPHVWTLGMKSIRSAFAGKGPRGWNVATDDVMSGIDSLIGQGFVDASRICIYGFSNGGSVVAHLVAQSNRFRCAVVVAPALANWVRPALLRTQAEWLDMYAGGVKISDDPGYFVELSPVFRLGASSTPMLIAAGDKDGDFLLDAIEIYNVVRRAGVEVTLIRYPEQGHEFRGAALRDFWNRQNAFMARHLIERER
jgi:dipeptidyl aminopeptidase/acylaminoacyl peptidase